MGKKEKIEYEEGSGLERLHRMWEEQDRKARKEDNRRFWKKVGIYGGTTLAMIAGGLAFVIHSESHPFEAGVLKVNWQKRQKMRETKEVLIWVFNRASRKVTKEVMKRVKNMATIKAGIGVMRKVISMATTKATMREGDD